MQIKHALEAFLGRAIAQTVSRWLPTAAAPVRARVLPSWICGGQSGAGAGFLRVLRFPLPIFIPPIAPQSPSSITWRRSAVAAVPGGLSLTPLIIIIQFSWCLFTCKLNSTEANYKFSTSTQKYTKIIKEQNTESKI
jgi:hypothetical protein